MEKTLPKSHVPRRFLLWNRFPIFPLVAVIFLCSSILFFSTNPNHRRLIIPFRKEGSHQREFDISHGSSAHQRGKLRKCKAPKRNVWKDLDEKEFRDVLGFVSKNGEDVGIGKKSHVMFVENLIPNKTDTLPFLDEDAKSPEKWARVVVDSSRTEKAGISEWMVGPLPSGSKTQILPLTYCYNSGRNVVRNPMPDMNELLAWFDNIVSGEMKDLIDDLLGEVLDPDRLSTTPMLMAMSRPSAFFKDGRIQSWAAIHAPGVSNDAWSLLPQGMYARFTIIGTHPSDWSVDEWYYGETMYNSSAHFLESWKRGEVAKTLPNKDGHWTTSQPEDVGIEGRELTAPVMVQPHGPRVQVDKKEQFVKWMGYEFYLSFSQVTSLSLFDVRFKGERILYELGLQEAMAHYAGNSPMSIGMLWMDTLFGFGFNTYELVPGYDCPSYATYLSTTFHRQGGSETRNNTICVFEAVSDHPLHRHTTKDHVTISRNSYLVVRYVATVGNYDYTVSYIFYLDGAIEVKVQASGYIFAEYLSLEAMRKSIAKRGETGETGATGATGEAQIYEYGYRIHDVVVSSMHDHGINFKADFDIAGTANTLYRVDVAPLTRQYPWDDTPRNTMHLVHNPITTETGLDWPPNSGAVYVILNNDSTNAWGEKRGYKITPGTGMGTPPHLTMQNSTAMGKAAGWAYHDLWILKNKDTERRSASEWNAMAPFDPLIDFDAMVDGESVVQDDLVVYFNLGVHHVSNSADIPNTLMHWSGTSVMFVPHNYLDRDASRESAQGVKLNMRGPGKGSEVTYYGGRYEESVKLSKYDVEPDLSHYSAPQSGLMDLTWNQTLAAL